MITPYTKKIYFYLTGKIILPEVSSKSNKKLAATCAANFASVGFPLETEITDKLASASADDIKAFYKEYFSIVTSLYPSKEAKPFYPGFPEEVMNKSHAEIFIDQVIYSLSGLTVTPSDYEKEKETFPFIGTPVIHVIQVGSEEDYFETMKNIISSQIAFSSTERKAVEDYLSYVSDVPDEAYRFNRENAIFIASITGSKKAFTTVTDVLRYAVYISLEGEEKQYEGLSLRNIPDYPKLSRGKRKLIISLLDSISDSPKFIASEMNRHKEIWKKYIRVLHVQDYDKTGKIVKAVKYVSDGKTFNRPERRIEEAIKNNDFYAAVYELHERSGEFMRRYDKLARMAEKRDQNSDGNSCMKYLLKELSYHAEKSGPAPLYSLISSIKERTKKETSRTFVTANGNVFKTDKKNRSPLSEGTVDRTLKTIRKTLCKRYENKGNWGKVYISPYLKNEKMPASVRDEGSSIGGKNTGTVSRIPNGDILRISVHWTNTRDSRVDLDLSVILKDAEGNIDIISWNRCYDKFGAVYSGDIQNGGNYKGKGAVEYIDLPVENLRKNGIVSVIPSINSYTKQKFCDIPHASFEYSVRDEGDEGMLFEYGTVVSAFELVQPKTMVTPFVIDLEVNELTWLNSTGESNVASEVAGALSDNVSSAKCYAVSKYEVAKLNAIANGTVTENSREADTLILSDCEPSIVGVMKKDSAKVFNLSTDKSAEAMMLKTN